MRDALLVEDLGSMAYGEAFERQRGAHARVLGWREEAGRPAGVVLLVEHAPPVITVSRRPDAGRHLLAGADRLRELGVEVAETDRGGDITYHGPGQLVAYPIVDLRRLGWSLHRYMRELEGVAMDACAAFGVEGVRDESATGVWVGRGEGSRKICAMGVRVRRWVTMHGLALNVTTDLSHFGLIVPCGLSGRGVTSLERELGGRAPAMAEVKRAVCESLAGRVGESLRARVS